MSDPRVAIRMNVNGKPRRVTVPPMKRLLDVLREDCALPGSKEGCGEGECGACSVLLDGKPVNSCLVPAVHADGARVVTVEGLAKGERLSALQSRFVEMGGAQCGICTPGMLIGAVALLGRSRGRVPGEEEVREALAGNLCRCTGYQKIVDAVRAAAADARGGAKKVAARKPAKRRGAVKKAAWRKPAKRSAAAKRTGAAKRTSARKPAAKKSVAKRRVAGKKAAARGRRAR